MAIPPGIVRVHQDKQVLSFQIEGQGTMEQSLPFRRRCEQGVADGVTLVRVDLGRCTYLDSTFLGTLFILKRNMDRAGQATFVLTALSPQCRRLLEQMRLDAHYPIQSMEEIPSEAWTVLCGGPVDCVSLQNNVIQAHQVLAELPGPVGEPFREVMRCVARDLERHRSGQAPPEAGPSKEPPP